MKFVVVGGGIAGVSCANVILQLDRSPSLEVILISSSNFVKSVENYRKIGQYGENFDVKETECSHLFPDKRFRFANGTVVEWNSSQKKITLNDKSDIQYDKLCIATGSHPDFQKDLKSDSRFIFIRDTQSANQLRTQLEDVNDLLIVGNGGIATELIYELKNINVTWLIRDSWMCASFFPEDMEKFIEEYLLVGRSEGKKHDGIQKYLQHSISSSASALESTGPALGPDWCEGIDFEKISKKPVQRSVKVLRNCVIQKCNVDGELTVEYLDRTDGTFNHLNPQAVIWAGGVAPNSAAWMSDSTLRISENHEIIVNDVCETSIPDVYACGDVCSIHLPNRTSSWRQRKLWTQARQQGEICGRSMVAGSEEARMQSMYFELFSHSTTFFGKKIVFLGDYKPERQPIGSWKIVLRKTEDDNLVRCVLVNNVVVGALLIGDTDMEETLENLILNKTSLAGISDSFLETGVDLDDYFD